MLLQLIILIDKMKIKYSYMIKKVPQLNHFLRLVNLKIEAVRNLLGKCVTTLLLGDSILAEIRKDKISKDKSIKVGHSPGAQMFDFRYYVVTLFKKQPDKIILHIGTKDASY